MRIPPVQNVDLALLKVLHDAGGKLRLDEAIQAVTKLYPLLTEEDTHRRLPSGESRWRNRIRWASQRLKQTGDLTKPAYATWELTPNGEKRLSANWPNWNPEYFERETDNSTGGVERGDLQKGTKAWKTFENDVIQFLNKLNFNDVQGGNETRAIFGQQIDACGGYLDALFLVEAKYSGRIGPHSIENAINNIVVNRSEIIRKTRKDPLYSKYKRFFFVIATRNIIVSKPDQGKANKGKVYLWDSESLLSYYKRLFTYIGKYAAYNLFGEMKIPPPHEDEVRIPALYRKVGQYPLYTFFIDPHELLKFAFVARRQRGDEKFYQRIVKRDRISKIARDYIDDQNGIFPNSIVVSLEKPTFIPFKGIGDLVDDQSAQTGVLHFPKTYTAARIIDGQHRLYAYTKTDKASQLLVSAFDSLDLNEQLRFFVDINEEQKPVDSNLIWDLNGDLRPNSLQGRISRTAKRLNDLSPFLSKLERRQVYCVYYPLKGEKETGDLNIAGICSSIMKTKLATANLRTRPGFKNPLYSENATAAIKTLSDSISAYFQLIHEAFDDKLRNFAFHSDGGASVLIYFYEKLLSKKGKAFQPEPLKKYVDALKQYLASTNIDDLRESLTSEVLKDRVTDQMIEAVASTLNDKDLMELVKSSEYNTRVDAVGQNLGELLNQTLIDKISPNWLNEIVDPTVLKNAQRKLQSKVPEDPRTEIYEFFSLGEIKSILMDPKVWPTLQSLFVNIPTDKNPSKFNTKDLFLGSFDLLIAYRNPPSHSTRLRIDKTNLGMIEASLAKLEQILKI